jgi:YfiH family protein
MKVFKEDGFAKACGAIISYGFYGRTGGVSTGLYTSLNCGTGSQDNQNHVAQNRSIIAKNLGVADDNISTVWQCHSATCLSIKSDVSQGEDRPRADALVTDVAGLAIGVLTADCGPVLFRGEKPSGAPVVGAAHAGWGGALGGVLEDTVSKMQTLGAGVETITACVGPCIMQASYEVMDDFMRPFVMKHEEAERFFMVGQKEGRLMFDLPGYIAFRLSACGVKTVRLMGVDTYRDEQNCFSYRRATHRGEGSYGRQMSCIVINP